MRRMSKARQTTKTGWRSPFPSICCTMLFILICAHSTSGDHEEMTKMRKKVYKAVFNISYFKDEKDRTPTNIPKRELGNYAVDSEKTTEGQLIQVVGRDNTSTGCTELVNPVVPHWIALVERGVCNMKDKMINVKKYNASGIVIYDNSVNLQENYQRTTIEAEKGLVAVFVTKEEGHFLLTLFKSGKPVRVHLTQGPPVDSMPTTTNPNPHNISKTSVLFVSISFIVLMIISLAWLVFYYIQRFRYAHAKERLTRRLANAAKKAIAKIPQRTIKSGDKELESEFDQCAVCIEGYKTSDVIRILPCKHIFHKSCVDPWLLDQRSCPMCKLDILREYGMQVHGIGGSQETVHAEGDSGGTGSGLADDPEQLSSPDEHSQNEAMNIVLIRHPSLHYHGSDTFCEEIDEAGPSERMALNPQPIECQTDIIQGDIDMDSESECTEMNALMTGRPHSDSLCDTPSHSQA